MGKDKKWMEETRAAWASLMQRDDLIYRLYPDETLI